MKVFIAPILLKRTISVKFPLFVDKNVLIRDFPIKEREEFFRVEKLEVEGTRTSLKLGKKRGLNELD